jgi:sulfatase maturation enzyme AslB (radical SAM superfamily)
LLTREIHVQVVTSAFRPLPSSWKHLSRLNLVVSVDGLAAEHNARRAPATYDRILKNIAGQCVTVHCTITGPMMKRAGYLREFLEFWTPRPEVRRVWFSLFTPQTGDHRPEILLAEERRRAIADLIALRRDFPKLDMADALIRQFAAPPNSPRDCVFAQTTETVTADLTTRILPCQFGGNPDCSSCGCIASMGLAAIAEKRLAGILPIGTIFKASVAVGKMLAGPAVRPASRHELRVLP